MNYPANTLSLIKKNAYHFDELTADASWLQESMKGIDQAEIVLIGEATHGTHDFYRMRAEITKRLISQMGFNAVVVEADWPDAYRVNSYVKGENQDADSEMALSGFKRFPTWMWRNADVLDFVGWLRAHNDSLALMDTKTGFYGLDLYSLNSSMDAVIHYLEKADPTAALKARERYACFDPFGRDTEKYSYLAGSRLSKNCEEEVIAALTELQRKSSTYLRHDGPAAEDAFFYAEQNARVVRNAEKYYRKMLHGATSSWNLRDQHMADTIELLRQHLAKRIETPKIVVWAHNSHLGDARATQMGIQGEWNVGELVRRRHKDKALLIGFTTFHGTVTAASNWGSLPERKSVRPALAGSYEDLFHTVKIPRFILNLRNDDFLHHVLKEPLLERAIGVIYRPDTERSSHYFTASLANQFDIVVHLDETRAVEPLEMTSEWQLGEAPETYPSAI